jgi:hypothetical protein
VAPGPRDGRRWHRLVHSRGGASPAVGRRIRDRAVGGALGSRHPDALRHRSVRVCRRSGCALECRPASPERPAGRAPAALPTTAAGSRRRQGRPGLRGCSSAEPGPGPGRLPTAIEERT